MVLLHRLSRGVAGVVGLGQEAYANQQQKKKKELSQAGATQEAGAGDEFDKKVLEGEYLKDVDGHFESGLPAPVIVPQRRPNARDRGFLCAYAPALAPCGISQETFVEFLDGFRTQAKQGAPFVALNIAVALGNLTMLATSLYPSPAMHFAALAVHLSVEAGRKAYINKKTNEYLDEMNASLFQPCGLYAMIMTYDPSNQEATEVVDFNTTVASAVQDPSTRTTRQNFSTASGKTLESQMPDVCPLVFPDRNDGEEKNGLKRSLQFAMDYYDRRAQASFAAKNPESTLNVKDHEFAGRYADPTTFEHSGPVGVLTGGLVDPRRRKQERRIAQQSEEQSQGRERGQGSLIGRVKATLSTGILYVLIVNMPSEVELQAAKEELSHGRAGN